MRKKWGRNENIHIGDIFECWSGPLGGELYVPGYDAHYYQVTALRGKAQVVLRPLIGNNPFDYEWEVCVRGRRILKRTWEEVTAWVIDTPEDKPWLQELQEVYFRKARYSFVEPETWEPWVAEVVRQEESARQNQRQKTE